MRKLLFTLATLIAAASTPAFADGFRAEIHGGWDRVTIDGVGGQSGAAYGLGLGYDVNLGERFFAGLDGNVDENTTKECADDVLVAGDRTCVKAGVDWSVGGRLGYRVGEGAKLYLLGAYTRARMKATYELAGTTTSAGDWGDGWRVGAGYQLRFGNGVYGKVEYRYSDYQGGFKRHNVIAGVGYQF